MAWSTSRSFYQTIADALGTEFVPLAERDRAGNLRSSFRAVSPACIALCRVGESENGITVALVDPLDLRAAEDLRFALGKDIHVVVAPLRANRGADQARTTAPTPRAWRKSSSSSAKPAISSRSRGDDAAARGRGSRGQRHAHHSLRRSDPLPGDPGSRERHPLRAVRARIQNPLPRGRRALRNGAAAAASRAARHLARQSDGEPEHRRAPPAAGWPHSEERRRAA